MKIPVSDRTGYPTVSPTMLRRYGVSGVVLPGQEEDQGCPRRFKAHYVEHRAPTDDAYVLRLGIIVHEALQLMEEESIPPEAALERCFPADLGPEAYDECLTDLTAYLERGASPSDKYAALATEQHLTAHLYDDEDHGPIYVQGFIDWIGVDANDPSTIHSVDYKHQRHPASREEVRQSLQFRIYDLLIRKNVARYTRRENPNVVMHLDAVKFSDVAVRYQPEDAEVFEQWLITMVRHILADDDANPVLNPGCAYCPVRSDCPAFEALPEMAEQVLMARPGIDDDDARLAWRDRANAARLLLEKAVKEVDGRYADLTYASGGLFETPTQRFTVEPKYADEVDLRALHAALGDTFYEIARTSKTAVRRATKTWTPSSVADVEAAISRVTTGSKVVRGPREENE